MSYSTKSIAAIIDDINSGKLYLPAIQRKYVWDEEQITTLMDSIMRGFPIGTFLFWNVTKEAVNDNGYTMYNFIKNYHERDKHNNEKAGPFPPTIGEQYIIAVLDGQQRLTSLYIALQGTLAKKLPNKQWKNSDAFPKKELYLNIEQNISVDTEEKYAFSFLTEQEALNSNSDNTNGVLWYKVKDILTYANLAELMAKLVIPNGWVTDVNAIANLTKLHEQLVVNGLINYFEVANDSIDEVLDIFIRVNSGGTVLSKSDLLYSTIVSHWVEARDKVDELLESINSIGNRFSFANDFIMRACLYLLDLDIKLKVKSFKSESVAKIEQNWSNIETAIKETIVLVSGFGFNSENLISNAAVLPIMYYRYKGGEFTDEAKNELRKYLIIAQLRQLFGASNDTTLNKIRDVLRTKTGAFSMDWLRDVRFVGDRTLKFTEDDIGDLFETLEKGAYTFMILSLLYPNIKYDQFKFHQDHLHPYTGFDTKKIKGFVMSDGTVITDEKIKEWQRKRNTLANLQLLEGGENVTKNKTPLIEWIEQPGNRECSKYLPEDVSYELAYFDDFMAKRKDLMLTELKKQLL